MPLSELLGQPRTLELLRRFALAGKAPATLVFTGPQGSGRFLAARLLGEALLCPRLKKTEESGGGLFGGAPAPEPESAPRTGEGGCGECSTCLRIKNGSHPDFRVVRPPALWEPKLWPLPKNLEDSNYIVIEQTRALAQEAELRPFEASCKIFVIDPADHDILRGNSANAMLKLLEEPPRDTYFFLIARSRESLLPTIASRSVSIALSAPLPEAAREILAKLSPDLPPDEIAQRLRISDGMPGAAAALELEKFRAAHEEAMTLLDGPLASLPARAARLPGARDKQREAAENLLWLCRELLNHKTGRPQALPEYAARYGAILRQHPEPEALMALLTALQAERNLNLDLRLQLAGRAGAPAPLDDPWMPL